MVGTAQAAREVTEACMRRMATWDDRARAAIEGGASPAGVEGPASPDMATRSSPTVKCGPRAATMTTRMVGSSPMAAMARGRSDQKAGPRALSLDGRSNHRVATWPSTSRVRTSEEKEATAGSAVAVLVWGARAMGRA